MKNLLKLTAFLLILAGVFSACKKPDDTKEPEINYPIDIPFTEYALDETSCQWKNLPYDEKVIIINSNAALENYLSFTENSYPAIDFSKKSLLLISGKTTAGIDNISKTITQLSADHFKIDIEIALAATPEEEWCVALITSKIDNESFVESNVTYKESIYPIDIPFEDYIPMCKLLIDYEKLKIINSLEEFEENIIFCNDSTYLELDFSKYTLWLAKGITETQIQTITPTIQQLSSRKYRLNIDIRLMGLLAPDEWYFHVMTQKIIEGSEIELTVNILN